MVASGYKGGSRSTCIGCIKCDATNAVTSFPLNIDRTPDEATNYDSVDEPITMNFQWATRSIAPRFISSSGLIDEGSGSGATNVSTLNFNNIKYNIYSVQIASNGGNKGTHNNWIIPSSAQSQNKEDLIITFYNPNTTLTYNYIIIVLPIIRTTSSGSDPVYLSGLSSSTNGSYSLSSCLPQDKKALFAYYATCIDGYTDHKTPENIYVFIAVKGINVTSSLMDKLGKKVNASGVFPTINLPFMFRFAAQMSSLNVTTEFTRYILTTRQLLNYAGISNLYKDLSINKRTDSTDAYKCIPLDPDTDISGGTISFDLESGELLKNVLAERDAARNLNSGADKNGDSETGKLVISIIGYVFVILIFFILAYMAYLTYRSTAPAPAPTPGAPAPAPTPSWLQQLPLYGTMIIVAGFTGFAIGMTAR